MGSDTTKPKPTNGSLLAIRGLEITFPASGPAGGFSVPLIDNLTLDIKPGRTLGLVGESGCGKSVTALSILGLTPPPGKIKGGNIIFDGTDLTRLTDCQLDRLRGDRIAMIFQEPMTALNPVFTVGDQIAEVLVAHRGLARAAALEQATQMLEKVGIPDAKRRVNAYPHELSGGMRQRVMIAMAMICAPDLLIADEPTTALDVTIQAQILDLMVEMQQQSGSAILFITHDLAVVSEIADDIAVMYAGKIVESGPVTQVLRHPRHPYTRALLATLPNEATKGGRLPVIDGTVPDLASFPAGCRFADRCAFVEKACHEAAPAVTEMDPGHFIACIRAGGRA